MNVLINEMDGAMAAALLRALLWLVMGLVLLLTGSWLAGKVITSGSRHLGVLLRKFVLYFGSFAVLVTVLLELGFDLRGVLATAGIATVAISFAAQTSLSNLISGWFLIGEKPFAIGDLIRVGASTGVVESIDLLSIKLRTYDNLFVRIPNEEMIRTQVVNISRYPIRRMDIDLRVTYAADPERVMELLRAIAHDNPHVLEDPAPLVLFNNLGEHGLEFRFGPWFEKSRFVLVRNTVLSEIRARFATAGIAFAPPRIVVDKTND
jgi:small-conductance mechanosensitive channel